MPRQRNPSRLQPLCIKQIVELLWQWRLNSRAKFPDEVDQMMKEYFHLPAVFTESILDGLKDDHFLYTGHVSLLVKLGLTKLSIVGDYYVDFDQVLKYTSHCMKHIISLDISRHWLAPDNMGKLAETIPNVEVLRLEFTRASDRILRDLGKYCSQLCILDVSFCPVTDDGVMELCAQCSHLKKLYLNDTKVTVEGAASILAGHPQLEELGVNSMMDVLAHLHASQLHAGCLVKVQKHGLRSVRFILEHKSARIKEKDWSQEADQAAIAQSFQIVAETCPELRNVTVNDWHPQQEWCLQMLSHCEHLSQVELDVRSYPYLTMCAIYPLLVHTRNLDCLTMRHVTDVNLPLLASCCRTHLHFLTLDDNTYIPTSHIVSLDISRRWLAPDNMEKLAETIPNVEVLRLQFTRVNDDILRELGEHCSQLSILDVSFCPVTDGGVMELCTRRPNLKKLYLSDTKVTVEGAAYILANSPHLEELGVNSMVDILLYLHAPQLLTGCLPRADKHGLRSIRLVLEAKSMRIREGTWSQAADEVAIAQSFHIVVGTCPELRKIIVNDWHPQQEWCLQMLSHCEHLSHVELDVKTYPYLTMNAIYPLLANIRNLDILTMRHVTDVDLPLLASCCKTNLRCLTLDDNTYIPAPEYEAAPLPTFDALEILTLMGKFPENTLFLALTSCPGLRELEVTHSYNLTHELLIRILVRNPLPLLGILILHECDRVNLQALQLLLQSDNDLYDVEIHNCRISCTQYRQLLQWMAVATPNAGIEFDFESRMT